MAESSFWLYRDAHELGISLRPDVSMPYTWTTIEDANDKWECDGKCDPADSSCSGFYVPQGRYGYPVVSKSEQPQTVKLEGCSPLNATALVLDGAGTTGSSGLTLELHAEPGFEPPTLRGLSADGLLALGGYGVALVSIKTDDDVSGAAAAATTLATTLAAHEKSRVPENRPSLAPRSVSERLCSD